MSDVTIASAQFSFSPPDNLTQVEARFYCSAPFLPLGADAPVTSGAVNSSAWFKRFICPASGGVLTLPDITLPATVNGAPNNAKYTLAIYAPSQTQLGAGLIEKLAAFENFALPLLSSPTTWAQVFSFNAGAGPLAPAQFKGYPRTIQVDTSVVGNVGTGLDPLHAPYSVPAGSLAQNGDYLEVEYGGHYASNDNDKRIVNSVGGFTQEDTGLIDVDSLGWSLSMRIVRLSATSVLVHSVFEAGILQTDSAGANTNTGIGGRLNQRDQVLTVPDLGSNALVLQVKGEGTSNNDVTQYLTVVRLVQQ